MSPTNNALSTPYIRMASVAYAGKIIISSNKPRNDGDGGRRTGGPQCPLDH